MTATPCVIELPTGACSGSGPAPTPGQDAPPLQQLVSADGLVTIRGGTVTTIDQVVPAHRLWKGQTLKCICRAYGTFEARLDGVLIASGVTSPEQSNVLFDGWQPPLSMVATQHLVVTFAQVAGPVTDIRVFIGYTELEA